MVAGVADVEVTREGAVLTITLNRPDVLNALNRSVHDGLYRALEQAKDPSIRAVVITGAGRGFCVGQDLQEFSAGAGDVADNLRSNYHRNVLAIRALEKPVIAAVNGPAAGAGMSLALACDIRIAADSASFVPGVHQHRPRARLGRHVAGAAAARHGARVRVADDRTQARRRGGAHLGSRERGRAGRRARASRAGGRGALRGDADACGLADEAPARLAPRRRRSPSSSSSKP